jgi:hypothetical protein
LGPPRRSAAQRTTNDHQGVGWVFFMFKLFFLTRSTMIYKSFRYSRKRYYCS